MSVLAAFNVVDLCCCGPKIRTLIVDLFSYTIYVTLLFSCVENLWYVYKCRPSRVNLIDSLSRQSWGFNLYVMRNLVGVLPEVI